MSILEKVIQMKQQGILDPQIIRSLRQEGISPKEINEALSQSRIKSELVAQQKSDIPYIQTQTDSQQRQMQPSIMPPELPETFQSPQEQVFNPASQEIPSYYQFPTAPYYEPYGYQGYYPEYQPQQPLDIETINDISEQIIEEKIANIKEQISSFTRSKEEITSEVKKINERLQKIEDSFRELQMAILKKIGDYGRDIQNISKEMHATQDSFSKILDPLTDNIRELQKVTGQKSQLEKASKTNKTSSNTMKTAQQKVTKKEQPGFENYLR